MGEDLLHFIWQYKKLPLEDLVTSKNEPIRIMDVGAHNHLSGPDFFNAKLQIDGQIWAGNVEIHLKSSDWYAHHHEQDKNYDNVILHVVWENDIAVFRKDKSEVPVLELKNYISPDLLGAYRDLFDNKTVRFINCEQNIGEIDAFTFQNWLERLYFERLEQKSGLIYELLEGSKNDWEHVLFALLFRNFGLKINGDSFFSIAKSIGFSTVRKIQGDLIGIEAVCFGQAGLLSSDEIVDTYYIRLKKEYKYLRHKFNLNEDGVDPPEFYKLRPPNFPTIRLSQLANVYVRHPRLFHKIIHATTLTEIYDLFSISASAYWKCHYTFGKESRKSDKKLTKKFIDLLIINTIVPLKFCYAKHLGKQVGSEIIGMISELKSEDNTIVANFKKYKVNLKNARESQAILQLYAAYCTQNKCLQCAIGNHLLGRKEYF